MNAESTEAMRETVASAAERIRAIPPQDGYRIGEVVDQTLAGESAAALFAITESLSKLVPFGARRLRHLHSEYCRSVDTDRAAIVIYPMMICDSAADVVPIGRIVQGVVERQGGATPTAAVEPLARRLGTTATKLLRFRDAFLVAEIAGAALDKIIPDHCPATALPELARLMKGRPQWVAQGLIVKAARLIAKRKLQGRQVTALVSRMLAQADLEEAKAPTAHVVAAAWYVPEKPVRNEDDNPSNATIKAA